MTTRRMAELVRDQRPVIFAPEAIVKDVCRRMRERGVGATLVVDGDGKLVGIFTGRDAVCRVVAEGRDPSTTRLADVMTRRPESVPARMTAIEALRRMQDCGCRHLPIVEGGKVLGVVSRGDFRGLENARLDEETGIWEAV